MATIKTWVRLDDGNISAVDTIEYENELWLVPKWRVTEHNHIQKPVRMFKMERSALTLQGDVLRDGYTYYSLNGLISQSVLDGTTQIQRPLLCVLEAPDLFIRR
jgi:hypothetical protein